MPIYEYRCEKCRHRWTASHSMTQHDRARPACPRCGSKTVAPVYSSFFAKTVRKS